MSGISGAGNLILDGLVLHLDAANPKSYVSGSTTWNDLSGNRNNGTLTNSPTFNTTNNGIITFDGINDYINCGNFGSLYTNGTISFWMKSISVQNYRNVFTTKHLGGNDAIRFEQYTTTSPYGGFNVCISNNGPINFDYSPTSPLTPNYWYNVVLTWNTVTKQVVGYLNNVKKFDSTCNTFPSTMPSITIGGGFDGARYFAGSVGVTMIYNKALTQQEIIQNYNVLKNRYI